MKDDRDYGSIAVGRVADLFIVNGKPTERVSDVRKVERVIRGGRRPTRLLLVGVLAVSQLGVGTCSKPTSATTKSASSKGPVDAQADSADQVLYGVRAVLTDQGVTKGILVADRGYVFEDGTRLELRGLTVTFLDTLGIASGTLTAKSGTYLLKVAHVDARGAAVVAALGGRKLQSETLRFALGRNVISGAGPYTLTDSAPKRQTSGVGFELEPRLTKVPKSSPLKPAVSKPVRDTAPKKSTAPRVLKM